MFCPNCGKELSDQAVTCPGCGHPLRPRSDPAGRPTSPKSRTIALVLCFLFGAIGVHRFYVGKVGTGIAMIFTFGGLGIWALVDFIMIITGSFTDIDGKVLLSWEA
jgi:TM2 domain-containing membrane protein YozV